MDEWEAKYKILASSLTKEQVESGGRLLEKAKSLSLNSSVSFAQAVELVIAASRLSPTKPTYLGFPIEVAEWMPANKAMVFGKFGAVIMDFETGECKVASKEVLEKALRNITEEKDGKHGLNCQCSGCQAKRC